MSSFYDKSSLVLIPSGTKTSKVFSQKPTNGDGDFDFTRSTAATRIAANGNIEKETQNLLLQSNTFDTTWTTSNASVTGGQSGYDGTNDAWLLENNSSTTTAVVQQPFSLGSSVKSFSVYAKAGNVNWLRILMYDGSTTHQCWFNLTDGSTANASNIINAKSTSIGGGWYRCEISANTNITFTNIYPTAVAGSSLSDLGDNIYIQDAQLNQGLIAQEVITTTTTALYGGITDNVPRLDYTDSSCPALLLEPQRTNLVVNSEYFNTTNWNIGNATATNNSTTSPEGVVNAIKLAEATTTNSFHYIGESTAGVTTAGTYSISGFVKKGTRRYGGLRAVTNGFVNRYFVLVDLDNGSLATTNTFGSGVTWSHEIKDYGNGWYRIEIMGGHTSGTIDGSFSLSDTSSPSFSGGLPVFNGASGEHIFCYGLQQEAGSYPTSYIPTYGTSVTRNADVCTGAGDAGTFNDSEGVLYAEISALANDLTNRGIAISDGSVNNRVTMFFTNVSNAIQVKVVVGGSNSFNNYIAIPNISLYNKFALKYKQNDFSLFVNGLKLITDTSGNTFSNGTLTELAFDRGDGAEDFYGKTNQVLYFPTALSDTDLEILTGTYYESYSAMAAALNYTVYE